MLNKLKTMQQEAERDIIYAKAKLEVVEKLIDELTPEEVESAAESISEDDSFEI